MSKSVAALVAEHQGLKIGHSKNPAGCGSASSTIKTGLSYIARTVLEREALGEELANCLCKIRFFSVTVHAGDQ
jgi:hypothetical protein